MLPLKRECSRKSQMAGSLLMLMMVHMSYLGFTRAVSPACKCVVFDSMYGKAHGIFTSPNWPAPYETNIDCLLYSFLGGENDIIELTFDEFDVQKMKFECLYGDFVRLYLHLNEIGVNESTPWNAILCGKEADIEQVHYSSGRSLIFEFHSDWRHGENTGFRGTFRFINKKNFEVDGTLLPGSLCDYDFVSGNRSTSSGHFYSPLFPSTYPKNIQCAYNFIARFNERVRITFEKIRLQRGDSSCLNSPDVIIVHDGKDRSARVIGQFCNANYYVELLSSGPDLLVEFISRSHFPEQGFKATYHFEEHHHAVDAPSTELLQAWLARCTTSPSPLSPSPGGTEDISTPQMAQSADHGCNYLFSSSGSKNGTLTSPNYPDPYPGDIQCTYHFSGEGIERAQVIFMDFDLYRPEELYHTCEGVDAMTVFISINGQRDRVDNFCGSDLPNQVMSSGRNLTLEFRSHASPVNMSVRGFRAIYQFVTNFGIMTGKQDNSLACGFIFNSTEASNGTFTSPNWPGIYPRDTECHYFFHGNPGEKVFIEFAYFDIEGLPPCIADTASDYLEFSNFHTVDRKIPRHCGMQKPAAIESEGDFFRVTFKTNDRFDGTGFSAQYQFRSSVDIFTIKRYRGSSPLLGVSHSSIFLSLFLVFLTAGLRNVR
ncbi:suppressor of lurcher protein 1-like [Ornithodoros turicata]|uniref:suppressor of lurcher protein 1-like n=1 Tax=Ornithodoros turicata TaxID=34597 RepID=UPI003139A0E9